MSPSRAVRLFGTEEPVTPPELLRAGPLTCELEAGNLRYIRVGGKEALRAVSFIVRDKDWGTYNPQVSNLAVEQRADSFTGHLRCPLPGFGPGADLQRDHHRGGRWQPGVRGGGDGGQRLRDQPHRLRGAASDRGRGGRAGRGPPCRRHHRARHLPGADRSGVPLPGHPRPDPRGSAGRADHLPHGGRCLRDGGSSQLERCLLQDLRAAAGQALALYAGRRRDHGAVGAADPGWPGARGRRGGRRPDPGHAGGPGRDHAADRHQPAARASRGDSGGGGRAPPAGAAFPDLPVRLADRRRL